jgi:hypothetical protein
MGNIKEDKSQYIYFGIVESLIQFALDIIYGAKHLASTFGLKKFKNHLGDLPLMLLYNLKNTYPYIFALLKCKDDMGLVFTFYIR